MLKNLRTAVVAVLFVLSSSTVIAKKAKSNLDSLKELMNQSQAFLIQGDRSKACQILITALNKEITKSKDTSTIVQALKKCTEIFLSEKAQQAYEVAVAHYENDKTQAIAKFREALMLEPFNGLILKGLLFTLLSQNECAQAKKNNEDLKKNNPYDEDLDRFKFLELVCSKNKSEALGMIVKLDPSLLNQAFWIVNKQRLMGSEKNETDFKDNLSEKDYSEMLYVSWIYEKNAKERTALADKYKQLCHNPIRFDQAMKYLDPWMCSHTKEIEEFLAKGERS